ncbi:MAG: pyridoxal phosphate-dependent aminotransferase [Desulfatiglandales bacterium]
MRKLARITEGIIGQPMFNIFKKVIEMERSGRKVFHFELGDSDFNSHPHIRQATQEALDRDETHYVEHTGILELRKAIADHTEEYLGFRPGLNQVVVIPANAVIDFVIRCVADPGDEIIFSDPGFSTYIAVANYLGVRRVPVPTKEEDSFHLEPDEIAKRITDKTRLLIINSPNNPTGAVLGKEEVKAIYRIAEEKDIFILSDEIYSRIIYGKAHYSPGIHDQCKERTIILNGFSKGYSMPGWRLGYAIGPEKVIEKMGMLFQTIYTCAPPFIQRAGIAALKGNQQVIEERINRFRRLRDLSVERLNEIPGISCPVPDGAYYVFPNIRNTGMSSAEFADFVLERAGVTLVPGTCFGEHGEGHVRMCFTKEPAIIEEACAGMKDAVSEFMSGAEEKKTAKL